MSESIKNLMEDDDFITIHLIKSECRAIATAMDNLVGTGKTNLECASVLHKIKKAAERKAKNE